MNTCDSASYSIKGKHAEHSSVVGMSQNVCDRALWEGVNPCTPTTPQNGSYRQGMKNTNNSLQ